MYKNSTIQVKISDNLTGIKSYRAEVDGKWLLMEYKASENLLFYAMDEKISIGEHFLKLVVIDGVDNVSNVSYKFMRE